MIIYVENIVTVDASVSYELCIYVKKDIYSQLNYTKVLNECKFHHK